MSASGETGVVGVSGRPAAASAAATRGAAVGTRHHALLWDLLHVALWDPPPAPLQSRAVFDQPGVRIYAEQRGRPGSLGVVGETVEHATPMGGCWMRVLRGQQGLTYVDDATPQPGFAVLPPWRRQSHGEAMMRAALDAPRDRYRAGVPYGASPECRHRPVRAKRLSPAGLRGTSHLMIAALAR